MTANLRAPEHILVIPNADLPKALSLAEEIGKFLAQKGVDQQVYPYHCEHPTQKPNLEGWDMVLTVGGDGTLLRVGHLCVPQGVPLLGIQAGRLGFLSELSDATWQDGLERLLPAILGQRHFIRLRSFW